MTRRAFVMLVEKIGATWKDDGMALTVDAPPGHRFVGHDVHWFHLAYDSPPGAWVKGDAYAHMAKDIRDGIEPCDAVPCDACDRYPEGAP
jgi:hypothetical protein